MSPILDRRDLDLRGKRMLLHLFLFEVFSVGSPAKGGEGVILSPPYEPGPAKTRCAPSRLFRDDYGMQDYE